jgi:site-specific recombinase XerD
MSLEFFSFGLTNGEKSRRSDRPVIGSRLTTMSLEPIDPETALELCLTDKEAELAESSIQSHRYRLKHFLRWCEMEDIDNLNDLTGRQIQQYRLWRRDDGDLSVASEKTQIDTLRVFIRWAESIDAVEQDLSTKVRSPSMTPEQNTRDGVLETEEAEAVLSYLAKYDYASRQHVTVALMWHTMMRVSSVNALDVDDYNPSEQYIEVRHRPETDTPIKNKKDGERLVALSDNVCMLLDDWIEEKRPNVTDDHGRHPLVASRQGRANKTTLRKYVYQATRPCFRGAECPEDRDPEECEAAVDDQEAFRCPVNVNPHAIRRGSITHSLNSDLPDNVVSDRANVSPAVIEQHYDRRTEKEKMEQRRDYVDRL